jgi:hypothetical protein
VNQPPPDDEVERIALQVERYATLHPTAADTPEGIARWWIADHGAFELKRVEAALELLVQRGRLLRQRLPDGNALYLSARRNPANPGRIPS